MEAVRPKNPGMGMGVPQGRRGGMVGDTGPATRRMNAIKHNHPGALENKLNRIGNIYAFLDVSAIYCKIYYLKCQCYYPE